VKSLIGGTPALLFPEVHGGIVARIARRRVQHIVIAGLLPLETLLPGPGFDQRAIDGKMFGQVAKLIVK